MSETGIHNFESVARKFDFSVSLSLIFIFLELQHLMDCSCLSCKVNVINNNTVRAKGCEDGCICVEIHAKEKL